MKQLQNNNDYKATEMKEELNKLKLAGFLLYEHSNGTLLILKDF